MDDITDMNENQSEVTVSESGNGGIVKISAEVVSTIACIATEETKGVAHMYTRFSGALAEKFASKKSRFKGVKVEMDENSVTVDVYIVLMFGTRVSDVAAAVQESVKNNIETMTGMTVLAVNVHVESVHFDAPARGEDVEIIEDETQEDIDD